MSSSQQLLSAYLPIRQYFGTGVEIALALADKLCMMLRAALGREETPRTARRKLLERVWVAVTISYGLARAVLVGATLSQYGVNPWGYLVIDLATSVPLGIATARVIGALVDRDMRAARNWAIVAVVTDFIPDIFILVVGRDMPVAVYVALGIIAGVSVAFGARGIARKVASLRKPGLVPAEEVLVPAA